MKEVIAKLSHLRIAPRKVRLVADLIRNLPFRQAEIKLKFASRAAAKPIAKLLKSALSNARHTGLKEDGLYIKSIRVDGGRILKRYMPRARGVASLIRKRSSHVTLTLAEK